PFAGDIQNDGAQFIWSRKRQTKAGRKLAQFDGDLQRRTHDDHSRIMTRIVEGDVFEESDMNVVSQERMKIEQHEQTIASRCLNIIKNLLRFQNGLGRLVRRIEGLEALGNGPTKSLEVELAGQLAHQRDNLRFFIALDRNQRCARADNGG